MTLTAASPAVFFAGAHQGRSAALIREGLALAGALNDDPLRGDPDDEQHHRIVQLIRPEPVDRGPWGGA